MRKKTLTAGKTLAVSYLVLVLFLFCYLFYIETYTETKNSALANPPPFTLPNPPDHLSIRVHSRGNSNDATTHVLHPDIAFFPQGWGNVNGKPFKYWMTVDGFSPPGSTESNEDWEEPAVVVSDDGQAWSEPADNRYNTNPITGWYWNDGRTEGGFFSDSGLVYNDGTRELWCYVLNTSRNQFLRLELYSSIDGVKWQKKGVLLDDPELMSPAIVKDGSNWTMWYVNRYSHPKELCFRKSNNGLNWSGGVMCGSSMRDITRNRDIWHIDVKKVGGEYWALLSEGDYNTSGVNGALYLVKSPDGMNWKKYDDPVLKRGHFLSWDWWKIYRSTFIVNNGTIEVWYSAIGSMGYHVGYTSNILNEGYLGTYFWLETGGALFPVMLIFTYAFCLFIRRGKNTGAVRGRAGDSMKDKSGSINLRKRIRKNQYVGSIAVLISLPIDVYLLYQAHLRLDLEYSLYDASIILGLSMLVWFASSFSMKLKYPDVHRKFVAISCVGVIVSGTASVLITMEPAMVLAIGAGFAALWAILVKTN